MLPTSLLNWFLFTLFVGVYWALSPRFRVFSLVLFSLFLVVLNDFFAAAVLVAIVTWTIFGVHWVGRGGHWRSARFWTAVLGLLAPLLMFKFRAPLGFSGPLTTFSSIALPLGISYFTIKSLMLLIDGLRDREHAPSLMILLAYLSFSPTLSAGPIDPPSRLVPQFLLPTRISAEGILNGLFRVVVGGVMKFVIADSLLRTLGGFSPEFLSVSPQKLFLFGPLYAFMIYFDFAGYSHIAIGCAGLLGFRCTENFSAPYLKTNISDFWRAWHMSLTGFLRRYLYLPLAMHWSRRLEPEFASYAATIVTFVVCGIWHGSGWNFFLWGLYHGLLIVGHQWYLRATRHNRLARRLRRSRLFAAFSTGLTFVFVVAGWYLFAFDLSDLSIILKGYTG